MEDRLADSFLKNHIKDTKVNLLEELKGKVYIEEIQPNDTAGLQNYCEVMREAYQGTSEIDESTTVESLLEQTKEVLGNTDYKHRIIVLKGVDGAILAGSILHIRLNDTQRVATISRDMVDQRYRNKNIRQFLLNLNIKKAMAENCSWISMAVLQNNNAALGSAMKAGFVVTYDQSHKEKMDTFLSDGIYYLRRSLTEQAELDTSDIEYETQEILLSDKESIITALKTGSEGISLIGNKNSDNELTYKMKLRKPKDKP